MFSRLLRDVDAHKEKILTSLNKTGSLVLQDQDMHVKEVVPTKGLHTELANIALPLFIHRRKIKARHKLDVLCYKRSRCYRK